MSQLTIAHNSYSKPLYKLLDFDFSESGFRSDKISFPFKILAQSVAYKEQWLTNSKVQYKKTKSFQQWVSEDFFVLMASPTNDNIDEVTRDVYRSALHLAESLGYLEMIRTWNFFPDINTESNGIERYQQFCVARQDILDDFPKFQDQNPAATAIGTHDGNNFVFLFAKTKGIGVENKRQLSAWKYPKHYAPKQPRFARAIKHSGLLMCSGTASVVGHETIHVGDVVGQLKESLINVTALLDAAETELRLQDGFFRIYLRDSNDLPEVEKILSKENIHSYVIVVGDICRLELLVECEAVFQF